MRSLLLCAAALVLCLTLACAGTPQRTASGKTTNKPREHMVVQINNMGVQPRVVRVQGAKNSIVWTNYSHSYATVHFPLSAKSGFTCDELRPNFVAALPQVSVDPEQIRQVLHNLIDNAVEAMGQRGAIDIETHHLPARDLVRIVVADDGPGIPPDERDKLFLPHYSTKQRGSGFGLAVVGRIVDEHGGSVTVTDNVPRGTRFVIELPC